MNIDGVFINASCEQLVEELQSQMRANNLPYINKIVPVPRNNPRSLQISCPYHKEGVERKPSAGIRTSDGVFHCFTCNEIHSLPEVISHCFGYNDFGAFGMSWITRNFGTVEKEERKDVEIDLERGNTSNKNSVLDNCNNRQSKWVTEEELDQYRYYHPYWKKRGIVDDNIIELFDLGYDKKTDCITMPVRDIDGNCLFVARRSVKTKFFNYPEGVEKPLYGLYELSELAKLHFGHWEDEIIVVESMIDALTCWQYGKYAVALNGLGNSLQFDQLRKLPCRCLILATDNDDAGMKARKRISSNVKNKILKQYVFPSNRKDINELSYEEFYSLKEIFI